VLHLNIWKLSDVVAGTERCCKLFASFCSVKLEKREPR